MRNAVSFWNINFISEPIPAADSSGARAKQIEKLNEASAEIAQSNKELEKVKHTSNTDEACQQMQSKVDFVLQPAPSFKGGLHRETCQRTSYATEI